MSRSPCPCTLLEIFQVCYVTTHNLVSCAARLKIHISLGWGSWVCSSERGRAHVMHSGTMRQPGSSAQLHYYSGMAGSAEGEALTPILMRLDTAQWPSRSIRQKQSSSYQWAPPPAPSIPTFKTFWQTYCSLNLNRIQLNIYILCCKHQKSSLL